MRPSSGQKNTSDWLLALAAGLALSPINAVLQLEKSLDACCVHIIRDRGTAQIDGPPQNPLQGQPKLFKLSLSQPAGCTPWADSGMKQAFVGVDVTRPGQQRLVQQSRLDREFAAVEEGSKLFCTNGQGLCARCGKGDRTGQIAPLQTAKASRVNKSNLASTRKLQACVCMKRNLSLRRRHHQTPRHPKMDNPLRLRYEFRSPCTAPAVLCAAHAQFADNVLPGPVYREQGLAHKLAALQRCRGFEGLWMMAEADAYNHVAAHALIHTTGNWGYFNIGYIMLAPAGCSTFPDKQRRAQGR